jgi:2-methylaconitate cis-trans-isomerase PrpF
MRPSFSYQFRIRAKATPRIIFPTSRPVQHPLQATYYRGGTSRALILDPFDLPLNRKKWPGIFRQLMGSGDPYGRQLDGMGAGISSLSKICLVEASPKMQETSTVEGPVRKISGGAIDADSDEAHVDYTFVGLGIETDEVDTTGNCGNMSSAIGPYAYNARLLPPEMLRTRFGEVTVKIRNTNTNKIIYSTFSVLNGEAAVTGNYAIDGVMGAGSKIELDFKNPYGSKTGKVLPTGKKINIVHGHRVTCVDGSNPAVFIRASAVGIDGTILPDDFNKLPDKLELLEKIRKGAAVAMGLADTEDEVARTVPKIGIVSMSSTHPVLSGITLQTAQADLVVRFISDTQPHRAIPLTMALTTAVAARIPGTVVEEMLAPDPVKENVITIGHASGRIEVNATMDPKNRLIPLSATVYRTAKRLFTGNVYWTDTVDDLESSEQSLPKRNSLGMAFLMEHSGKLPQQSRLKSDNGAEQQFSSPSEDEMGLSHKAFDSERDSDSEASSHLVPDEETEETRPPVIYQAPRTPYKLTMSEKKAVRSQLEVLRPQVEALRQHVATLTHALNENKHQRTWLPIIPGAPSSTPSAPFPDEPPAPTKGKGAEWKGWSKDMHKRYSTNKARAEAKKQAKKDNTNTERKRLLRQGWRLSKAGNIKKPWIDKRWRIID